MNRKRMRQTALGCLAGIGAITGMLLAPPRAVADVVTSISTLDQANRLSLFHDYSIDAVGLTTGSVPGSAGGGVLSTILGNSPTTQGADTDRSYEISFSPLAGYDSNPEARRYAQGGVFAGGDLDAVYHINIGPNDPTLGSPTEFQFAYDATGAVYDGTVFKADVFQQTVSASYRRSLFQDSLFVGLKLNDQFTMEHGEAFLNTVDASPWLEWFLLPQESIELSYDYTRLGYFFHAALQRDTDADRHTANVMFHFYSFPQQRGEIPESPDVLGDMLRATLTRATIGYAFVDNEAAGRDYLYNANRLSVGLEGMKIPRLHDVTMDVKYAHEWDNYLDPNNEGPLVLAGSPKQIRRKDHVDVFTVRTDAKLIDLPRDTGTLGTFVQFDLIADRANILVRHYNEYVISGGINYRY